MGLNRNNIEYELDLIVDSVQITDYDIAITWDARNIDADSDHSISINGDVIHKGVLPDGTHTLTHKVNVPINSKIMFEAKTSTHKHGQHLIMTGLVINGVDMFGSNLWALDRRLFTHTDGRTEEISQGLYHNGTWTLEFPTPLFPWLRGGLFEKGNVQYPDPADADDIREALDTYFRHSR